MVDDYYFQLVLDDMPMWGFLGSKEHVVRNDGPRARYWLNTHYHFELRCDMRRGGVCVLEEKCSCRDAREGVGT